MEENNKSQVPQDPSVGQPNEEPQNDGQSNLQSNTQNNTPYGKESTYWEGGTPEQYQGASAGQYPEQSSGQYTEQQQTAPNEPQTGANPAQEAQPAQTPEQFYQYYQQQMGGAGSQQAYGQPQYNQQQYTQQQQQYQQQQQQQQYTQQYQQQYQQPQYGQQGYQPDAYQRPKKKHRGALVAVIVILLLLAAGAVTAYAFQDTLMNSFAKLTKSPAEYYAYVEKNAIAKAVNEVASAKNTLQNTPNAAYDVSSEITVNRDTLDSLLQSSLGMSLSDLEAEIGIPLESIGFDAVIGTDGDIINETFGLKLNQVNLITMELFMDSAAEKILLRLPELSQAYLSVSGEDTGTSAAKLQEITPERTADLLKRYGNIIVDNINQVALEDDAELSIDTLTTKSTKLTVTISEQDFYNMVTEVLEEAREDEYIIDLLPMLDLTEEEYQDYVDQAIDELDASSDSITDQTVTMLVYVNSKGEIIGREFSADDTDVALGYTKLSKSNYDEYNLYVTDDTGTTVLDINGSQKKTDGSYDGDASIEISSGTGTLPDFSIDISYEDVYQEKKNDRTYQYGSFTLSSLDLIGLQVTMDYYVEEDVQKSKLAIRMGASSLVTVDTTLEYIEDYEVKMPSSDAEVYDIDQAESYLATFNLEDYIADLSDKLGIDLQSLLEYYMSGYYY
jgi:hypothetical protein